MKRVIKYNLYPGKNESWGVKKLLSIGFQGNDLVGWFEEGQSNEDKCHTYIYLTGEPNIPDEQKFVATAQLFTNGHYYVVHAYE